MVCNYRWHCPQEITCLLYVSSLASQSEERSRLAWVVRSIVWNPAMFATAPTATIHQSLFHLYLSLSSLLLLPLSSVPLHSTFPRKFHPFRLREGRKMWVGHVSLHFAVLRRARRIGRRDPKRLGNFVFGGRVGRRFHRGGPRSIRRTSRRTTPRRAREKEKNRYSEIGSILFFSFSLLARAHEDSLVNAPRIPPSRREGPQVEWCSWNDENETPELEEAPTVPSSVVSLVWKYSFKHTCAPYKTEFHASRKAACLFSFELLRSREIYLSLHTYTLLSWISLHRGVFLSKSIFRDCNN